MGAKVLSKGILLLTILSYILSETFPSVGAQIAPSNMKSMYTSQTMNLQGTRVDEKTEPTITEVGIGGDEETKLHIVWRRPLVIPRDLPPLPWPSQMRETVEEHVININDLVISLIEGNDASLANGRSGEEDNRRILIHRIIPQHRDKPDFLEAMKQLEKKVKSSYGSRGEISTSDNDFCKMLLLDGCFIFVCLKGIEASVQALENSNESIRETDLTRDMTDARTAVTDEDQDEVKSQDTPSDAKQELEEEYFSPSELLYNECCCHNMLLLENQIPFFVIQTISGLVAGPGETTSRLVENVVESVEGALECYPKAICKSNRPKNFHHLLHLCHMYFRPCWPEIEMSRNHLHPPVFRNLHQLKTRFLDRINQISFDGRLPWRRATEYHLVEINFKKKAYSSEHPHSLLDVEFCNGVIETPCLTVEPNTYSLFCNLIAFEQTCPQFGSFVTAYIKYLSRLISMPEDVSLLTERGIIVHHLNSDAEVSDIFKGIRECIVYDFDNDSYLKSLCVRLEEHYQLERPVLRELIGSITSKLSRWTQKNELSDYLFRCHQ